MDTFWQHFNWHDQQTTGSPGGKMGCSYRHFLEYASLAVFFCFLDVVECEWIFDDGSISYNS